MYHELRRIGLTQYEAKVYQALLEYGRSNAREISERSGVPPTAVHPNLKSLLDKKLIQKFTGQISWYEALQPRVAISAFIDRKKKKISSLGEELVQQAENALHKMEVIPQKEVVKISLGKQASSAIYDAFIKQSKKSLYILGWLMYYVGDKYYWLNIYKKLIKKGIDVRLIITGKGEKQWQVIEAYKKVGIKVRYLPLENFSLVVSDGKECKITLKNRDLPEKFNVQISDPDLSKAMEDYFLMSWERAREIKGKI